MTSQIGPALAAACTAALFVRLIAPPRKRLAGRIGPYASLGRSRLGTGHATAEVVSLVTVDERSVATRVFGPTAREIAGRLAGIVDATDNERLTLRLRQAGIAETDSVQHRIRQLCGAVGGLALGTFLGLIVFGSISGTLLMMLAFGFPGATMERNRITRAIDERRGRMRTEVYTVAHLVAVHLRTGHGPVEAVRSVATRGHGPVATELREALGWMGGGVVPQEAYTRLAATTPEPSAARLYRLLAASAQSGGDVASSLLAIGEGLRAERRDEIARSAVKRRTAMLVPLLLLIAPVMMLFVAAALPSLVVGPIR
ncbi:MAG: tight adherence protein C [Acidimicrobiales bacterium]|jgi:tight adherence protein C